MINLKKLTQKLEKAKDVTNSEEDTIKNLLEYASYPEKVIDYNKFKDISPDIIEKAIKEVDNYKTSLILKEMVISEFVKDNAAAIIPKLDLSEEDFF